MTTSKKERRYFWQKCKRWCPKQHATDRHLKQLTEHRNLIGIHGTQRGKELFNKSDEQATSSRKCVASI